MTPGQWFVCGAVSVVVLWDASFIAIISSKRETMAKFGFKPFLIWGTFGGFLGLGAGWLWGWTV